MKQAGESAVRSVAAKLGTAIVEMQDHVTALQKNIDTLKGIKSALGVEPRSIHFRYVDQPGSPERESVARRQSPSD